MKYIDDADIYGKKVLLRCDYNVPIVDGQIMDDMRIAKSLTTINYLLSQNCSIIILSHLGRIKTREDKLTSSLKPVYKHLEKLLGKEITFLESPVGMNVISTCKNLLPGQIVMLENTRFCDFPEKLESNNDLNLAKYWASLADVFVVDAFSCLHRAHTSTAGISKYLPTYFGLLVKEELENLKPVTENIQRPFVAFMGGSKVEDKLKYIKSMLQKCDYLLLGGGIANSFLYALGYDIGDSIATSDELTVREIKDLIKEYQDKIILPIDFVFAGTKIYDLNTKSINKYLSYFEKGKTIFINGTCGKFEENPYAKGTVMLFEGLKNIDAIKIAGGGDTINAIKSFHLEDAFTYLSTGGGASLEYISSGFLEAIKFISEFDK